jgi:tetratricopeptide (TPR) repeat protein
VSGVVVSSIGELETASGWSPIRKHFDLGSFGVNAWTTHDEGEELIGEHDEVPSGHEELYLVTAGRATFSVDGKEIDAPAGTLVFVRDPALKRSAVAREAPATVVSMGGAPGQAYAPRAWEVNAEVLPLFESGEYAEAKRLLETALGRYEDKAGTLYNLACAEAQLGERDAALEHIVEAASLDERYAGYAETDDDLASIRDDPRFPR